MPVYSLGIKARVLCHQFNVPLDSGSKVRYYLSATVYLRTVGTGTIVRMV